MKKNVQKTIAVLGAAVLATGMVGCGSSNTNTSAADTSAESDAAADTTENSADAADLSGSITLAGSTSMEKFANALAETFMEKYPYRLNLPALPQVSSLYWQVSVTSVILPEH